jgi:hypothetical protein
MRQEFVVSKMKNGLQSSALTDSHLHKGVHVPSEKLGCFLRNLYIWHVYIYVCMHVCMRVCMRVRTYEPWYAATIMHGLILLQYAYVCVCVYIYAHTYKRTNMCDHMTT